MLFSSELVGGTCNCDCVMAFILFSNPYGYSRGTSAETRIPPASSRPDRSREFRRVRCESQTLADGFLSGTARCCLFLLGRPAEHLAACSEHLRLDFVISCCLLPLRGFPLTSTVTLHVRIPAGVDPPETRLNDDGGCPRTRCREKPELLRQSIETRSSEPPSCASFNSRCNPGDFAGCA